MNAPRHHQPNPTSFSRPERYTILHLEAIPAHAFDVGRNEIPAFLIRDGRVRVEEARVARGLGFRACAAPEWRTAKRRDEQKEPQKRKKKKGC